MKLIFSKRVSDYYFFEKNLFGDIVGIYNGNGRKICTYTYDAWGGTTTKFYPSAVYEPAHKKGCGYLNHYHLSTAHQNHIWFYGE